MYSEAVVTVARIEGSDKSNETGIACGNIAESYGKIGNVKNVQSAVATLCPDKSWKSVALSAAIRELARLGDVNGAQLLQSKLDGQNDTDGPIAVALARNRAYEVAAAKARGILNEAIRSDAVRRMASLTPPPRIIMAWLEDTRTFKHDDDRAAAIQVLTAALARSNNAADAMRWLEPHPSDLAKARGYLGIAQGLQGIVPGTSPPGE